MTSKSY